MSVIHRTPPGGEIRHPSAQLALLVVGAVLVTALVVLALLSLAGWL